MTNQALSWQPHSLKATRPWQLVRTALFHPWSARGDAPTTRARCLLLGVFRVGFADVASIGVPARMTGGGGLFQPPRNCRTVGRASRVRCWRALLCAAAVVHGLLVAADCSCFCTGQAGCALGLLLCLLHGVQQQGGAISRCTHGPTFGGRVKTGGVTTGAAIHAAAAGAARPPWKRLGALCNLEWTADIVAWRVCRPRKGKHVL